MLIPVYTHYLAAAQYGLVETVVILAALANLTVALEIAQGMGRYFADTPDVEDRNRYPTTAFYFAAFCYVIFAGTGSVFSGPLSAWLFRSLENSSALIVALWAIALNGLFAISLDVLRWQLRPISYVLASAAYLIFGAVFGASLVAFTELGVLGVFLGQLVGAAVGLSVALLMAEGLLQAGRISTSALRQMLRFSLPLVLSSTAIFASTYVDRITVGSLLGADALGLYGVAARLASTVGILTVGLQAALSPLVYKSWRSPDTPGRLAQIFRIYCVAMTPVIGGLGLFATEIIELLTEPNFHGASTVLPILAGTSMLLSAYIFAPGLYLGKRTGMAATLSFCGALVNLGLSLILTAWLGILGAALAAFTAAGIVFAGHVVWGGRYFRVPFSIPSSLAIGSVLAGLIVAGLVFTMPAFSGDLPSVPARLIGLICCCAFVWQFGLTGADRHAVKTMLTKFVLGFRFRKAPK